ncbi:MAG TPA: enoyl-CoA hydratase family protein [Candidatus Baltobacteraceae bacterium]|jgi:enoyl-CoA hydratase/carnithine racemase|nr:enoyl-CoA hydratase family protein [Candidatus Baltobacteraceae bacterium]
MNLRCETDARVLTITLDRPEKKNPLTFETYEKLRELFSDLEADSGVRAVVLTGAGGNFCSGGDVREIIGPLTRSSPEELLKFTQMTAEVVKAMRRCPQPILAAIDGVCAGAGAILAMASDLRYGTPRSAVAFLFVRVGLAGCDMGACSMLPRMIGLGRASELLYTGRTMHAEQALAWGFYNAVYEADELPGAAAQTARRLADGPAFAHAMTKRMLREEWDLPLDAAIDAEARAQALCMQTNDFRRAYEAFVAGVPAVFEGN